MKKATHMTAWLIRVRRFIVLAGESAWAKHPPHSKLSEMSLL